MFAKLGELEFVSFFDHRDFVLGAQAFDVSH